jgi:hypothetical protein
MCHSAISTKFKASKKLEMEMRSVFDSESHLEDFLFLDVQKRES